MNFGPDWVSALVLGAITGGFVGAFFGALLGAVLGVLVVLWWLIHKHRHKATKLNLKVEGASVMNIGDTATATITPTGPGPTGPVPAPVTSVVYTVTPAGAYTVVPAADGLSAVMTAAIVGTGNSLTVTAVNSAGATLSETAALPDITSGVVVADQLNLVVTTP